MANKVLLKKSSVAAKVPLTTDLDYGELAINYADGKLYYKTATNTIGSFTTSGGTGTVTSVSGTGSYGGLTLSGTVTSSGSLTLGGTPTGTWPISVSGNAATVTDGLTTNNYSSYALPLSGGTMTGTITGGSSVSTLLTGNYGGVNRGQVYNDTGGFGLLSYVGGWAVRVDYGGNSVYMPGTAYSTADMRAPVFYDYDNTSYYVNPNGTSYLYGLTTAIGIVSGGNNGFYNDVYYGGARNPIWAFGNATSYGLSYFQGAAGLGGIDTIGIHPNGVPTGSGSVLMVTSSYTQSLGSMRAPLFYDSDNTSYYVDPASTSNLSATYIGGHLYTSYNANDILLQTSTTGAAGLLLRDSAGNFRVQMYGDGTNYGFLNGAWAGWDLQKTIGGNLYLNGNGSYYLNLASDNNFYRVYGQADIRSPIYYDLNDTTYYVDPASTSVLNRIDTVRGNNWLYLDYNYGHSIVGTYSSYRYQGVFAMGDAYKLPADGTTTGNLYGMAWSHPNAGGIASNLNSHGLLLLQNGSFMAALSTNGTFSADVRGTVFYDYNNTGYYVDPSSISYLYDLALSGAVYFRPNTWIQFNGSYGLYWPNHYGAHLHANDLSSYAQLAIRGSKNGYSGIYDQNSGWAWMNDSSANGGFYRESSGRWSMYYNHGTTCWGLNTSTTFSAWDMYGPKGFYAGTRMDSPIYYDASNSGYYVQPVATSVLWATQAYYYRRLGAGYGYLDGGYGSQETGATSGPIYTIGGGYVPAANSLGNMYGVGYTIGNISGIGYSSDWGFYVASGGTARHFLDSGSGTGYASGSYRAPLFYDLNNTGYYCDPASTSNFNVTKAVSIVETKSVIANSYIDVNSGNYFTKTISSATTFTINATSSGNVSSFILELTNAGSATITWFSGVKWAGGTAPTLTSSGVDILGFYTHDGGTTWRGMVLAKDSK